MRILLGLLVVLGSVLGGFTAMGGALSLLWQPFEFVIILGGSIGAYITANPTPVLKRTPKDIMAAMKGQKATPDEYLELMACLYHIMRSVKQNGGMNQAGIGQFESHFQDPYNSSIFKHYPGILARPRALTFITDFMKLLSQGSVDQHELEDLLDEEIKTLRSDFMRTSHAMQTMADGMPALGIVAAVMGVIKAMASIDKSPEVLGSLIGSALVGTFAGVLMSYGFFGPLAAAIGNMYEQHLKYFESIKVAILSAYNNNKPEASVEFARKILFSESRPSFEDVESRVEQAA